MDEELEKLIKQVLVRLKAEKIYSDSRGEFFSNKQLNDLREVLEAKGFTIAKHFQQARIQPKDSKWEQIKNRILLDFLERLEELNLDLITSAFMIGKLNPILSQQASDKQ